MIVSMLYAQFGPIDAYVHPLVETNNFAGVILVHQHGEVIYQKAFGLADRADGTMHDIETVFQIASVTKPFTATAIMLLQEHGLLSLDDPVAKYVPKFNRGDEITIHHLLTHTSGIQNINGFEIYDKLEKMANTPKSLVSHFIDLPLEDDPGSSYTYSNSNYSLLALIIEQASEMSYGAFLRKHLIIPLGLEATGHPTSDHAAPEDIATGYQPTGITEIEPARKINWTVKTGNGSMYSNAPDLMRWSKAFFDGKITSLETRDLMLTKHVDHVGYGWFIRPRHGRTQYHINGRSPGYSAVISYFPDEDLHIVILSNNYIPLPTQMGIDIAAIILGEPYEEQVKGDGKTPERVADSVSGKYQFGEDFYVPDQVHEPILEDGYLMIEWGPLLYRGNMRFINRTYWSDVEFRKDTTGEMIMDYDGYLGKRISRE